MKTVLDRSTREELIKRINTLDENSNPQWGKMNVHEMLKHCSLAEEMLLGKTTYKRAFIGRLFGKVALKGMLKDDKPLKKNSPTSPDFKIKQNDGDLPSEKYKLIALIEEYQNYNNHDFEHWFFGKMTKEQVGQFAYKHADHHLRQFNV